MKVGLKILPKPEVLDTQGRAVEMTLKSQGHNLSQCQVGKYLVLNVNEDSQEVGLEKAKAMAESGLYNPLIEQYEIEIL